MQNGLGTWNIVMRDKSQHTELGILDAILNYVSLINAVSSYCSNGVLREVLDFEKSASAYKLV